MADLKSKPPVFAPGENQLSAGALNKMLHAIPRLITGGSGIKVSKLGDRVVVSLKDVRSPQVGASVLATITEKNDTYLVCNYDGATINVAKPWGLRKGVDFPSVYNYTYYTDPEHRTATDGDTTEEQYITPGYEVGEELLVRRLPSSRIVDGGGNMIVWIDENTMGRSWATAPVQ